MSQREDETGRMMAGLHVECILEIRALLAAIETLTAENLILKGAAAGVTLDPNATRVWCERLARVLPAREIAPQGTPYLSRFYCAGWRPDRPIDAPSIYLHHFHASDPDNAVHSHPWAWSLSLILCGGYRETRCLDDGARIEHDYLPGDINVILARDRHRIELLERDCWTLFLAGPYLQPWEFYPVCGR